MIFNVALRKKILAQWTSIEEPIPTLKHDGWETLILLPWNHINEEMSWNMEEESNTLAQ